MTVGTAVDLEALAAAIAAKDVASAVALFAEDVELEVVDERNRPGTPFRARGREAMAFALTDATEGLQHRITAAVADGARGDHAGLHIPDRPAGGREHHARAPRRPDHAGAHRPGLGRVGRPPAGVR